MFSIKVLELQKASASLWHQDVHTVKMCWRALWSRLWLTSALALLPRGRLFTLNAWLLSVCRWRLHSGMLRLETRRSPCVMPARSAFRPGPLSSRRCWRRIWGLRFLLWLHCEACGNPSFPTRDWTPGPSSEGAESQPLGRQGSPSCAQFFDSSPHRLHSPLSPCTPYNTDEA